MAEAVRFLFDQWNHLTRLGMALLTSDFGRCDVSHPRGVRRVHDERQESGLLLVSNVRPKVVNHAAPLR